MRARVLVVDNHDSFVHTLVGYVEQLGADVELIEADEITDPTGAIRGFDAVLVSPGPGCSGGGGGIRRRRAGRGRRGGCRCSASASVTRRSPRRSAPPSGMRRS